MIIFMLITSRPFALSAKAAYGLSVSAYSSNTALEPVTYRNKHNTTPDHEPSG